MPVWFSLWWGASISVPQYPTWHPQKQRLCCGKTTPWYFSLAQRHSPHLWPIPHEVGTCSSAARDDYCHPCSPISQWHYLGQGTTIPGWTWHHWPTTPDSSGRVKILAMNLPLWTSRRTQMPLPSNPVVYLLIYHFTIYFSLSGLSHQIPSSHPCYHAVKTIIPLGIIILH